LHSLRFAFFAFSLLYFGFAFFAFSLLHFGFAFFASFRFFFAFSLLFLRFFFTFSSLFLYFFFAFSLRRILCFASANPLLCFGESSALLRRSRGFASLKRSQCLRFSPKPNRFFASASAEPMPPLLRIGSAAAEGRRLFGVAVPYQHRLRRSERKGEGRAKKKRKEAVKQSGRAKKKYKVHQFYGPWRSTLDPFASA
jgi:hypothetical protein